MIGMLRVKQTISPNIYALFPNALANRLDSDNQGVPVNSTANVKDSTTKLENTDMQMLSSIEDSH
jgi:hypothetical protein